MRAHTFQGLHRFFRSVAGRAVTAGVIAFTFPSLIDFGNYAYAIQVDRQHTDEIKAIAAKLKIDPEFLLHPGPKKPSALAGFIASIEGKLGLFKFLGATKSVKPLSATTNIPSAIQDVKSRYALVAADTALAKVANLVAVSLAPSAFVGKNRGQIRAQVEAVLRLVSKDFLPVLKPGLPGVANGRDGQVRAAVNRLRSDVRSILNAPGALTDSNLESTLAQIRNAVSTTLSVPAAKPRWTKDPFPLRDSVKIASTQELGPGNPPPSASPAVTPGNRPLSTRKPLPATTPLAATPAPEVVTLAQSLATPAKIFGFVHDKVGFAAYSGVAKGSLGTLEELSGNDWDQALLLSDLLYAAGYQTQFETGKVTIPIAQAMNLVGTEDPMQAGNLLATAGYDALVLTAQNTPVAVQLTHVWVRAYIPYVQNRGASTGSADTWVRMDPSFKRYQYQAGIPIAGKVTWNEDDYLQNASLGTGLIPSPTDYFGNKAWAYLRSKNIVCQNLSQVGKVGSVVQENFPYVPATLTVKIEGATNILAAPPSDQMQTVAFSITSGSGTSLLSYQANLADLWGKKLSLTFAPATADDAAIIASYGDLFSTPAYLVSLKPVLSLDDVAAAQGAGTPAGADLDVVLSFGQPNVAADVTHHDLVAGETHTEVFDAGTPPDSLFKSRTARLQQLVANGASADAILSEKLFLYGLRYFQEVDAGVDFSSSLHWQRAVKRTFETDVRRQINVAYNIAGAPLRLSPANHNIDTTRLIVGVIPIGNNPAYKAETLNLAGAQSSALEASIWEELESQRGISAVRALVLSKRAGQTIYTANTTNVDSVLAAVSLSADVESEIRGAVLQGRVARVASSPITVNRWTGTGYILEDPTTGAATYPISGGSAGGGDSGGGTPPAGDLLGSEPWLEGSPLGALLQQLLALLGGGGDSGSSGAPATMQSDPVNVASGNMYRTYSDLTVVARGIPVSLSRTYNSRSTYDGPFGYGWTFSYGEMLLTNPDGSVTYREADGTEHLFTKNTDGTFASPAGKHIDLASSGGGFTMRFKDGMTQSFDATGNLTAQTDLNGNTVTVNRDAQGNPTTVVDASGRAVLTFTLTNGKVTNVTDLGSRSVTYAYTGEDLTSVTDTAGKVWTFQYDLGHNLTQAIDPLGHTQVFDYDTDDRLFHHVDATGAEEYFHYDIANRQSVVTDKRGGDRYIQYDDGGKATLEADPAGNVASTSWDGDNNRTQVIDSRGYTTAYEYDPKGNVTKQTNPDTGTTTTTYDGNSRPLTTTDPLGATTTNTYDASGNLLTTTKNVSGVVETTTNTYDANGQLQATQDPAGNTSSMGWNANGVLVSRTDAANNTTTMTPDNFGRVTSIKDPAGNTTAIVYDAKDRMTSLADPFNNQTTFTYDAAGRRTDVTTPRGTTHYEYDPEGRVKSVSDPLGNVTKTAYDAAGNVLTRTDARGGVTTYEYDAVGRVTKLTDANGAVFTYGYCAALGGGGGTGCSSCGGGGGGTFCDLTDPNGRTIHQDFDVMGRVVAVTDSLSHTMTTQYDKAGRKTSETDANGNTTAFGYDEAGHLVTVTESSGAITVYGYDKNGNKVSQKDANGHTWTFGYDALNRLVTETDPLGRTTTLTYDGLGNLKTKTDAKGQTIAYGYNVHRLTTVTYPDGTTDNFTYDALGRRSGTSNAKGTVAYTYDNLNRPLTVTYSGTSDLTPSQTVTAALAYAYDAAGNRAKLTTPKGTVGYIYDAKNRLTDINDPVFGKFHFAYDAMDRRTELDYPNGAKATYAYDNAYRMTAIATTDAAGNVLDAWSYQYDAVGNRTSKTDKDGHAETYQYDPVYRLTKAAYTDGTFESFTYDNVGNRLTRADQTGAVTSYSYDVANQMLTAGSDAFSYDKNGNLAQKTAAGGAVTTYTFDFNNRLKQVTAPEGTEKSYYTPDGQRSELNGPTADAQYTTADIRSAYDTAGNPVIDMGTDNQVWVYRLYGPGVDEPLGEWRRVNSQTTYLHRDALGSITLATDTSAHVVYRQSYRAFGQRTMTQAPPSGVYQSRLSYTGRENSVGSLYNYRSRYYDSGVGRFLSQDTYRGSGGHPPSTHRYVYTLNSPVNYRDPSGRFPAFPPNLWGALQASLAAAFFAATLGLIIDYVQGVADNNYRHTPGFDAGVSMLTTIIGLAGGILLLSNPWVAALLALLGFAGSNIQLIEIAMGGDDYTSCEKATAFGMLLFEFLTMAIWFMIAGMVTAEGALAGDFLMMSLLLLSVAIPINVFLNPAFVNRTRRPLAIREADCAAESH